MNPKEILIKQKVELAIKQLKQVKFDYVKVDLEITRDRVVNPYQLHENKKGDLIGFYGIDIAKAGWRLFRFEGIQNLQILDTSFEKDDANSNR